MSQQIWQQRENCEIPSITLLPGQNQIRIET